MSTQQFSPGIEVVLAHMRDRSGWGLYEGSNVCRLCTLPLSAVVCPLGSLERRTPSSFRDLTDVDVRMVVVAADNAADSQYFDPALRAAMLEAGRIEDKHTGRAATDTDLQGLDPHTL